MLKIYGRETTTTMHCNAFAAAGGYSGALSVIDICEHNKSSFSLAAAAQINCIHPFAKLNRRRNRKITRKKTARMRHEVQRRKMAAVNSRKGAKNEFFLLEAAVKIREKHIFDFCILVLL